MYYVIIAEGINRQGLLQQLNAAGVNAVFHYVPLHLSPAGQRLGRVVGHLQVTEESASRLIRLPLWVGMTADELNYVTSVLEASLMTI